MASKSCKSCKSSSSCSKAQPIRMDIAEKLLRKRLSGINTSNDDTSKPIKRNRSVRRDPSSNEVNDSKFLNEEIDRFRAFRNNRKFCPNRPKHSSLDSSKERSDGKCKCVRKSSLDFNLFRRRYNRGELPVTVQHTAGGLALSWSCGLGAMTKKDYETLIPIFLDGLKCSDHPYKFIARQGAYELIESAKKMTDEAMLDNLKKFVFPLRSALLTRDKDTILATLRIIKHLITTHPGIGKHLVPYHRQLIPPILNELLTKSVRSLGDKMDYSDAPRAQFGRKCDPHVAILEYLMLLEKHGGARSYWSIKSIIPTYEHLKCKESNTQLVRI